MSCLPFRRTSRHPALDSRLSRSTLFTPGRRLSLLGALGRQVPRGDALLDVLKVLDQIGQRFALRPITRVSVEVTQPSPVVLPANEFASLHGLLRSGSWAAIHSTTCWRSEPSARRYRASRPGPRLQVGAGVFRLVRPVG